MNASAIALKPGTGAAPVVSGAFLRAYVVTMRPYLLFMSGITGLVGLALAPQISVGWTLLFGAAFFGAYGFGQALTDCFQMDTDQLSSPYRPLVRGAIRRQDVLWVSLAALAGTGALLVIHQPWNLLLAALGVVGLVTYTPFKRRWWGGPFYNAWIVVVLCLMGYLSGVGTAGASVQWTPLLARTLLTVLFGYANFVLTGYFKDVSADRATGYRTLVVVAGFRTAARVSDVLAGLTLASAASAWWCAAVNVPHVSWTAVLFGLAGVGATLVAQLQLHAVREEAESHHAIALVVHAYQLLLSGIAVLLRPAWALPLVLFYLGFVIVLRARPARDQI